ncbi:hypothetical protein ACFFRR_004518 [Megaselia abdita]
MKLEYIALLIGFSIAQSFDEDSGWFVPNLNGSFYWMTKEEYQNQDNSRISRTAAIKLFLYSRSNPTDPQEINPLSIESLKASNYNSNRPTKIIIHGWTANFKSDGNILIKNAYLKREDSNVIMADWSINSKESYPKAAKSVKSVGEQLATFIDLANFYDLLSFERLEIDGFSLGAHCAGIAGKNVKRGRISVIRGLDAALPLFSYMMPSTRLASSDAKYVEVIHTCAGWLGFLKPIGHADFYVNGGKQQPECGADFSGSCSHSKSCEYYADAINSNGIESYECRSFIKALKGWCRVGQTRMGHYLNKNGLEGVFYTKTKR